MLDHAVPSTALGTRCSSQFADSFELSTKRIEAVAQSPGRGGRTRGLRQRFYQSAPSCHFRCFHPRNTLLAPTCCALDQLAQLAVWQLVRLRTFRQTKPVGESWPSRNWAAALRLPSLHPVRYIPSECGFRSGCPASGSPSSPSAGFRLDARWGTAAADLPVAAAPASAHPACRSWHCWW